MNKREIQFPNGTLAQVVTPPIGASANDLLRILDIPHYKAVIVVAGGAANMEAHIYLHMKQLLADGLAHAAATLDAVIIDGGTHAGVMALMGQGVAEQPRKPTLLGVSPAEQVTYPGKSTDKMLSENISLDPNHSHFVLVETDDWGGETETMYELARVFSEGRPSVAVLINGGSIAKKEVLYNVRQKRPVIVIEGSGRLADEIVGLLHEHPSRLRDSSLIEIMTNGNLHVFPLTGTAQELEGLIHSLLDEQ